MRMEMFQILYEVWDNDDTFGTFGANLFSKYVFGMKHGTMMVAPSTMTDCLTDWLIEELQNLLDLLSATKKYLVKLQNKLLRLFVEL